jgi:hypothetical protein
MTFIRVVTATIMDGMVVRYQCGDNEISASRNCVMVSGYFRISSPESMKAFEEALQNALAEHVVLKSGGEVTS